MILLFKHCLRRCNKMLNLLAQPFYSLLMLYIHSDLMHSYKKVVHGKDLSNQEREDILNFRNDCYAKKQKYLVAENDIQTETEKNYDLHSYHSRVFDKENNLVAVVRLLPFPFELSALGVPADVRLSQYSNYLEISRLVTNKPGLGIGKRLLIFAGIWAIRDTIYDGFLAVCRKKNLKLFSLFGLSRIANFGISHRPGAEYSLIKADFRLITKCTLQFFTRKLNPVYQLALGIKIFSRSRFLTRSK